MLRLVFTVRYVENTRTPKGYQMNTKEQRSETRFVPVHKPMGMLFLYVCGECLPVRSIRDISQTGISLWFDYDIRKSERVDIEYKDRNNEIKVSGIVVWCNQADQTLFHAESAPKHLIGINLFSPNLLLSFMQIV